MQLVVDENGLAVLKAAIDGAAKIRRDVAGGGTSAELSGMNGVGDHRDRQ